jgi:hypothetical protein
MPMSARPPEIARAKLGVHARALAMKSRRIRHCFSSPAAEEGTTDAPIFSAP